MRVTDDNMKPKHYQNKVEQDCPSCKEPVLAVRINGFYGGSRDRIFLWECPMCLHVWKGVRPRLKSDISLSNIVFDNASPIK